MDMLVDMVSRIQKDIAILREENRLLRTPATSQVVQAPRRAALTTTKVPRFDGTPSLEQYHQVFEAIVWSNGWDNDTAATVLSSGERRTECRSFSTASATAVAVRIGGRINGPIMVRLWNRASNWFWIMLTRPDSMPLFWILRNR